MVVEAMAAVGIDISDREPRRVTSEDCPAATIVATMGCSTLELDESVTVRDRALADPHGEPMDVVRRIRDEVRARTSALFDEYTTER